MIYEKVLGKILILLSEPFEEIVQKFSQRNLKMNSKNEVNFKIMPLAITLTAKFLSSKKLEDVYTHILKLIHWLILMLMTSLILMTCD